MSGGSPTIAYGPMQPSRRPDPPDMPWYQPQDLPQPTTITIGEPPKVTQSDSTKVVLAMDIVKAMELQAEILDSQGEKTFAVLMKFFTKKLRKALG